MHVMKSFRGARLALAVAAGALVVGVLIGCSKKDEAVSAPAAAGRGAPAPEVAVLKVTPERVALTTELPGRLEASRVAQVRARATGILNKRVFTEGTNVRVGQVLYRIDPSPYQAAVQSAQAQLAQAQAQLANASGVASRYKPLVAANAVSKQEYDAAVAQEKAAKAQVASARAALRTANINLGYTTVTASISGRIGRSLVTEGALVSATEGTQLATIQQINPLYINISQSASEVLRLREALQAGKLTRAARGEAAQVKVLLEDGRAYDQPARLLFTDLTVDASTGDVSLRAEVPNPSDLLLPGMYVRVQLELAQFDNAVLVPKQAVTRSEQGDTVMIVAEDGTVAPHPVTISGGKDQNWIVTGGLQAGEQVMVEGAMKLMMGAKVVKPVPWQPAQSLAARVSTASDSATATADSPAK